MAPSHVPSEHLPLQGQTIYNDPNYATNLFPPAADQYAAQPWNNAQLNGLVSSANPNQSWHHNAYLQQPPQQQQPQQHQPQAYTQPYQTQTQGLRTASPYQYGQFGNHDSMPNYGHSALVDPSLGIDATAMRQQQQSPYAAGLQNGTPSVHSNTVAPQALQQGTAVQIPRSTSSPYQIPKTTTEIFAAQRAVQPAFTKPPKNPEYELPKGRKSGGFLILDQSALAKATNSNTLNKLVTFGTQPLYFPSNRTALPMYMARQSVKDLRKAGADNKKLLAKKLPAKTLASGRTLQKDISDSESYDESSDDSEYTDEEDDEPSPLPPSRPDGTHEATRYDIIKATWHPRNSQPSSEKIKASLRDFWEVVNTIQKRWRQDSKSVTEAEEQKKTYDLPELKQRVTGQRALLQVALKSALEYAHPDVLYHFGQMKPFLYLCYQFLANRFKMKDYDGDLSSAMYEVLSRCVGTLNNEVLEETKLIKALISMKKNANDKHKVLIQDIIDGAAAGSKKAKISPPPEVENTAEPKTLKRPALQPLGRQTTPTPAVKKLKPAESTANGERRTSMATASSKAATTGTPQLKRPGEKVMPAPAKARGTQIVNKPSTLFASLSAASKKPTTTSTLASHVRSAAKPTLVATKDKKPTPATTAKPAFSFKETMDQLLKPKAEKPVAPSKPETQLPPETPEETVKRLRKESRRHLHVAWRPDAELVEIKLLYHDPEEELGHDENFVRDAGDIGGEGRMFKQHKEMMDDEDDDDLDFESRPWTQPSDIDFTAVDIEERKRNYYPFGGGMCTPSCPEKEANIQDERTRLLVHYDDPRDIPYSPREPLETRLSSDTPVTSFGPLSDIVVSRQSKISTASTTAPFPDLEQILKNLAGANPNLQQTNIDQSLPTASTVAPVSAPPSAYQPAPDITALLNVIGQGQPPAIPFSAAQQPAVAAPSIDLNSIMASLGNNGFLQANGMSQIPPLPVGGWAGFQSGYPLPQSEGGAAYQPQMQAQPNQPMRGGGLKRQRDDNYENERGGYKKNKSDQFNKHMYKVLPCRFFQSGRCNKGDDCTYIHDMNM